jgi:nucleotide-binding universal stress UspA family protein
MGEIKNEIVDTTNKLKDAAESAVSKVKNPDDDFKSEYETQGEPLDKFSPRGSSTTNIPRLNPSSIPQYKRILVPDDNSEWSDKALSHAIYLSNTTGAEIVILNVVKDIGKIQPTTISATTIQEEPEIGEEKEVTNKSIAIADNTINTKKDIELTIEGSAEQMMEERISLCKQAGAKNKISYKMHTGKKLVEEILDLSKNMNIDLIIMTSSKVTSPLLGLASVTRKIIDGSKNPVLVINHEGQW